MATGDLIRNAIAGVALFVSAVAVGLSGLTFNYQFADHISAIAMLTNFSMQSKVSAAAVDGKNTLTSSDTSAGIVLTLFNQGNRQISINNFAIYIQPGDYQTLVSVDKTPPCNSPPGSMYVYDGSEGRSIIPGSTVVEAQHIFSVPVNFTPFPNPASQENIVQGIVCVKFTAFNYKGAISNVSFAAGMIRAIRGIISNNNGPAFSPPRGGTIPDVEKIF